MNAKKVAKSIETIINGLEDLKDEILAVDENTVDEAPTEEAPKSKKSTKTEKKDTKSKKTTKATKAVETDDETDEEDYASMKYNDLKKLAVERGMKSPNVSKDELIAFLTGEAVSDDEDEVENEDIENETDEEDLTEKVSKLLEEVDTEDIAGFLTENGISAKGKRPSLIAKIVTAIEDGDLSLDDLEVEDDDDEEEAPAPKKTKKAEKAEPKKSAKAKKKAEPEPEDDDEEESDELFGYEYDEDEEMYIKEDEENELLAQVVPARMDALKEYLAGVEKDVKKKAKRAALLEEVENFFGDDYDDEEDNLVEFAAYKFLLMTDDEGETHDMEEPYEINEIAVCCGQALTETDDGFVCEICESEYDADDDE